MYAPHSHNLFPNGRTARLIPSFVVSGTAASTAVQVSVKHHTQGGCWSQGSALRLSNRLRANHVGVGRPGRLHTDSTHLLFWMTLLTPALGGNPNPPAKLPNPCPSDTRSLLDLRLLRVQCCHIPPITALSLVASRPVAC